MPHYDDSQEDRKAAQKEAAEAAAKKEKEIKNWVIGLPKDDLLEQILILVYNHTLSAIMFVAKNVSECQYSSSMYYELERKQYLIETCFQFYKQLYENRTNYSALKKLIPTIVDWLYSEYNKQDQYSAIFREVIKLFELLSKKS